MSISISNNQSLYVDPALFSETVSFAGVFKANGQSSPVVSVEVSYSRTNDHPPYGVIRGTAAEYDRLEIFFRRFKAPYRLESTSQATGRDRFVSQMIIIRSLSRTPYPDEEAPTVHQVIGNFEVLDFSIFHKIHNDIAKTKKIVFLMAGPRGQWAARSIRRASYDGNVKTEHIDAFRSIVGVDDLKLTVQRHYLHRMVSGGMNLSRKQEEINRANPHRSFMVEADLVSLEFEDLLEQRSNSDFCERAIEIADASSDVTSFISKASTQWFSYVMVTPGMITDHFKTTKYDPDPGYHYEDHVVGEGDVPEFFGSAVSSYLQRRREGLDLMLPLRQYVAAHRAYYMNDQLSTIYNALEQVVSMTPKDIKGGALLTKSEFRLFKRVTERTLTRLNFSKSTSGTIINKLRNTTDPGFRGKLLTILSHWNIDISDIGGEEQLAKACKTRNALIHSHTEPDIRDMVQGRNFLVTVFERLALALLGWNGHITTPTLANRSLLVSHT